MTRYFEYGTDAVDYLKAKDKKLGAAIDAVGVVRREMDEDDLFSAIVIRLSASKFRLQLRRPSGIACGNAWAR